MTRPPRIGRSPAPGQIVWLASYPKSGNTWLRGLLTAYRAGPAKAFDINALAPHLAASRAPLDELLGLSTTDLTAAEVRELLPHAYRIWSALNGAPHCLKTHDAYAMTEKGVPLFPADATRAVVHLVRDPRDVSVSFAHHSGHSLDKAIDCLNDPGYWVGRSQAGPGVPQFLSDWSSHAQSWLECPLPRRTLRFEDMLTDPAEAFRGIVADTGLAVEEASLAHALASCTFDRLQAQERATGFSERSSASTAPFFRSGRAGGWREVLSDSQCRRIVDAHGEVMQRLGYTV